MGDTNQQKDISFFIQCIKTSQPFVFAKYGDGEYFAATRLRGGNCDGTPYTLRLGEGVKDSFRYISCQPNVYIGQWNDFKGVDRYFQELVQHQVQWTNYNIFIFKSKQQFYDQQLAFYKAIRQSEIQKIYVCNPSMAERSKALLNLDTNIVVDPVNWFESDYGDVLSRTVAAVKDPNNVMILTSAGMGAKVLISDLHKLYPNATIIDVGSALDFMCSGRRSRDFHTLSEADINEMASAIMT
jgi:hypothetical protein